MLSMWFLTVLTATTSSTHVYAGALQGLARRPTSLGALLAVAPANASTRPQAVPCASRGRAPLRAPLRVPLRAPSAPAGLGVLSSALLSTPCLRARRVPGSSAAATRKTLHHTPRTLSDSLSLFNML